MRSWIARILLFGGLLAGTCFVQAQSLSHYPAGVEGIKGASLPPPGIYLRDYNYMYIADSFKEGPPSFDLFANVQAPRLIYITDQKLFGGYYGMDAIIPLAYQDLDVTGFGGSNFSLGDIFLEPITISWHPKRADLSFGYGIWFPSAGFEAADPVTPGKGFMTHMLTGGITYYPDKAKTWSISALSRYEISHERKQTRITPGQYYTLEYAAAKSLSKTIDVGVAGYYQAQVNKASGLGASNAKDSIAAIGPEITLACPKLGLSTSIRYLREMGASNRPEGNVFNLIFTKRLGGPAK